MINLIKYITVSLYHIIKHINLLYLRIDNFLLINRFKHYYYIVMFEIKSIQYYNFFYQKYMDLGYLPSYLYFFYYYRKKNLIVNKLYFNNKSNYTNIKIVMI